MKFCHVYLRSSFFLLVFLCISKFLCTQQIYSVKNLSLRDGLASNDIISLCKTKAGALWIGTNNGISVYDGKAMYNYSIDDGLPHVNCWQIVEDSNSTIWIGTYGGGVAYFKDDKFHVINEEKGLIHNSVRKLFLYNNQLFVGTQKGLSVIDIETKNIVQVDSTGTYQIMDFFVFDNELYFVTYRHGVYRYSKNKVIQVNDEKAIFSSHLKSDTLIFSKDGNGNDRKSLFKIPIREFIDNKKTFTSFGSSVFWQFSEVNNRLFGAAWGVNFNTGGLYEIHGDSMRNFGAENQFNSFSAYCLLFDSIHSQLYVGSFGKGVYIYDFSNVISRFNHKKMEDLVFSQSNRKLEIYNEYIQFGKQQINAKEFVSFTEDFIRSSANKYILLNTEKLRNFKIKKDNLESIFSIHSVSYQNDHFYVQSSIGLFIISIKNENLFIESYFPISAMAIGLNEKNELYFQFPYSAVSHFSLESDSQFKTEQFFLKDTNSPRDIFQFISLDGTMFGFSHFKGVYKIIDDVSISMNNQLGIKNKELKIAKQVSDSSILFVDILGDIYLLTLADGNLSLNLMLNHKDLIGTVALDIDLYENRLLVASNLGLEIHNLTYSSVQLVDEEIGLFPDEIKILKRKNDSLYILSESGFCLYFLSKKFETEIKQNLKVKSIQLENELVNIVQFKETFDIGSDQNNLRVIFDASAFHYPKKIKYRYKLEGEQGVNWSDWKNMYENPEVILPSIPAGNFNLVLEYYDLFHGKKSTIVLLSLDKSYPFYRSFGFFIFITFLFAGIIFYWMKVRFRKIYQKQKERSIYEKRVEEAKMEALTSQMNPHFIFNSMNAIQSFVVNNETGKSIEYIGQFSRLIRNTLDYSSKKSITIQEECDYLRLFAQIQNIRFNNLINFTISISKNIDVHMEIIPPMLIQPLIENCFEHAFDKTVLNPEIKIHFGIEKGILIVEIEDNGLGFGEELSTSSKGLKLVKERLRLVDKNNDLLIKSVSKKTTITLRISPI